MLSSIAVCCLCPGIDHIASVRVVDDSEWADEDVFGFGSESAEDPPAVTHSVGDGAGAGGGGFYITQLQIPTGMQGWGVGAGGW
jgi:hypothetical protein